MADASGEAVMGEFSIPEVALSGFRIVRGHPRALLAWAPLMLLVSLAVSLAAVQTGVAGLDLVHVAQDPQAAEQAMSRIAPFLLFSAPLMLLLNAVLYAAMNRAVFDPGASRFGYLRLGADELRQLGLQLLFMLVMLTIYVLVMIAGGMFTLIGGLAGGIAGSVFAAVAVVAGAVVVVAAVVRFSLAFPLTFVSGHIGLAASWRLSQGRGARMFLAYALATALALFVAILGAVIEVAIGELVGGGTTETGLNPGAVATLASLATPAFISTQIINALINALIAPVLLTPPAVLLSRLQPAGAATARAA
ncbi:MAG TPA: hypothetical protein VG248_08045 [Caulobacteraceae bacterium]|nr:hypothetical protein [Caulobacteraceae bacterium]